MSGRRRRGIFIRRLEVVAIILQILIVANGRLAVLLCFVDATVPSRGMSIQQHKNAT